MASFEGPVKLAPTNAKKSKQSVNWYLCVICQVLSNESITSVTEKVKCSLLFAAKKRKDDVYSRLISEFKSLDEVQAEILKYHKSCNKTSELIP